MLRFFGIELISKENYVKLNMDAGLGRSIEHTIQFFRILPSETYQALLPIVGESKSQLQQDLFVLWQTSLKQAGYFVEFGATDGVGLSNTFLLEDRFQWRGILAEPAFTWHEELLKNRPNCHIDNNCVWKSSNQTLYFHETHAPQLSTISSFLEVDLHANFRKSKSKVYGVKTISLMDLLKKYNAPFNIDYLSIDTEGSEYEILEDFDFNSYSFSVITIEHNYTSNRDAIFHLLTSKGYERVFPELSKFDDWYIRRK